MKIFFVIVASLALVNSVLSTPAELTAQQDQLQAWANNLIQQGNDLRQEIQYEIYDTYVSNVEEHFADIATEFLNDVLVHQGRRGKAMAAEIRALFLAFRRELKYLMSYTRINEYMLKFFTDIIGPIIQEEYPIVAFQAAFEFDSAAAGACWTPVGDAVDAAIATFDTDVGTLMPTVGDFFDYDLTSSLDDDVHDLWDKFDYYLEACASGETAEDDSKCLLDAFEAFLDNAPSFFNKQLKGYQQALDLNNLAEAVAMLTGPVQAAWDDNIGNYYDCIWALYEASIA